MNLQDNRKQTDDNNVYSVHMKRRRDQKSQIEQWSDTLKQISCSNN